MPELRFAITQQQKSVTGSHWYIIGQLTRALAILAVITEESLTQASFQTLSQPSSLDGWQSQLSLPKDPGVPIDPLNHSDTTVIYLPCELPMKPWTIQTIILFHPLWYYDKDLPQSFKCLVPWQHYARMHTDLISNSAILSNNFVSLLSDL